MLPGCALRPCGGIKARSSVLVYIHYVMQDDVAYGRPSYKVFDLRTVLIEHLEFRCFHVQRASALDFDI